MLEDHGSRCHPRTTPLLHVQRDGARRPQAAARAMSLGCACCGKAEGHTDFDPADVTGVAKLYLSHVSVVSPGENKGTGTFFSF